MRLSVGMWVFVCVVLLSTAAPSGFALNLVDTAPVFYIEPKTRPSWIHMPYDQYDIEQFPYVDEQHLQEAAKRFERYRGIQNELGYDAFAFGYAERLLTYEALGIFEKGSKEWERAVRYREFFNGLMQKSNSSFFMTTDFQPMHQKIREHVGKIEYDNPKLQEFNTVFFEELFEQVPDLDGVIVRVGEGGEQYASNPDYASELVYTSKDSIHVLLETILPVFQKYNRTLIVRAWSVGLGELGDVSSNPFKYEEVFGPFYDEQNLVVSIKYGSGDFWYFVDENPLLGKGRLPQIVEFQIRREYEGYGTLMNHVTPYYIQHVERNMKLNPNFEGVYTWTLIGGWDDAQNVPYFSNAGIWIEIENDIFGYALRGVAIDEAIKKSLDKRGLNTPEMRAFVKNSGGAIRDIYYVKSYAESGAQLLGVPLPKPAWIYWDTPVHDVIGLTQVIKNTGDIDEEIRRTQSGVKRFVADAERVRTTHNDSFLDDSLEYQQAVVSALGSYKRAFLSYYAFLDGRGIGNLFESRRAADAARVSIDHVQVQYEGDDQTPSLDFEGAKELLFMIRSLHWRSLGMIFVTLGHALIVLLAFMHWSKGDQPKLRGVIALFYTLIVLQALLISGLKEGMLFALLAGTFVVFVGFCVHWGYGIVRVKAFRSRPELGAVINLSSVSALVVIVNVFLLQFVPERLWIRAYEVVFGWDLTYAVLLLLLLGTFYASKIMLLRRALRWSRHDVKKIVAVDVIVFLIACAIAWEVTFLAFAYVNGVLDIVPSIITDSGIGPELIRQMRIL